MSGPFEIYMWQTPSPVAVDNVANALEEAPILRLEKAAVVNIVRFLQLRDISSLRRIGSLALWTLIAESTTEALHTPARKWFTPVLLNNPFPMLSSLPHLHTVRLHRVWWTPSPGQGLPWHVLPVTLRHLEFESCPLLLADSDSRKVPHKPYVEDYVDFDFSRAFPQLERLKIVLAEKTESRENGPHWIRKLPPTIRHLSLRSIPFPVDILFYVQGVENQPAGTPPISMNPLTPAPTAIPFAGHASSSASSSSSPSTTDNSAEGFPFPHLRSLVLAHPQCQGYPDYVKLPPQLRHLTWMPRDDPEADFEGDVFFASADHTAAGDSSTDTSARLSSSSAVAGVPCTSSSSASTNSKLSIKSFACGFIPDDGIKLLIKHAAPQLSSFRTLFQIHGLDAHLFSSHLTHLEFAAESWSLDALCTLLNESHIHLKTLKLGLPTIPEKIDDEEARSAITSAFSSLTHLHVPITPHYFPLLPSDLQYLGIHATWTHPLALSSEDIKLLPPHLTNLWLRNATVEIGDVPLLPRSLLHLSFHPVNLLQKGTVHVTDDMKSPNEPYYAAELEYDTITPKTHLLFGLPPHLISLSIFGDLVFESRFGLFLPRSVRHVNGDSGNLWRVNISDTSQKLTSLERIGSWFGVTQRPPSKPQLLLRALSFFPPGCVSSIHFRISISSVSDSYIDADEMKRALPYRIPAHRCYYYY